jgi:tetratricopeptide (TPR) repeat protein
MKIKYLLLVLSLILLLVIPRTALAQTQQPYSLIDGLGTHHHAVTTSNPEAQKFFDQGLNLIYAFNHDEAVRSFKYAAEVDPNMAMAYWGMALGVGANINLDIDAERELIADQAIQKALALAPQASAAEQAYIRALAKRYSNQPDADLYQLAVDYAQAMSNLVKRYPDDLDAATLYAESLMDLHPWQLWSKDGQPQGDTQEIVAILESVLQRNPQHPGANHYYIHAVEASQHPELALQSAERLETLVPSAGHLVHMPSHIYFRVGDYEKAMRSNQQAIAQDDIYLRNHPAEGFYPQMYYNHNLHFLMIASSMADRYEDALQAADQLVTNAAAIDPYMPMLEGFLGNKMLIQTRFQDWDAILQTPAPDTKLLTTNAIWHFARGMAHAATGNVKDAIQENQALLTATQTIPETATIGFTPANRILNIATKVLNAQIATAQHDYDSAIELLQQAVIAEDALDYVEPPDWYLPTREALGDVLLAKGDYTAAKKVFQEDLKKYPHNKRALLGLQKLGAKG